MGNTKRIRTDQRECAELQVAIVAEEKQSYILQQLWAVSSLRKQPNTLDQIGDSKTYIEGFSDNVKDILANFVHKDGDSDNVDLLRIYNRLDHGNKLYAVVQQFVEKADLHSDRASNAIMGMVLILSFAGQRSQPTRRQVSSTRFVRLSVCSLRSPCVARDRNSAKRHTPSARLTY